VSGGGSKLKAKELVDSDVWREDVERALGLLGDGKLLILSVMGSKAAGDPLRVLRYDFVAVTREALKIHPLPAAIELNLSCPNKPSESDDGSGVERPLCESLEDTREILPLIAKLSYMPVPVLEKFVGELHGYVRAFSGINTLQVRVERPDSGPTFGTRKMAGLSGIALRNLGLDFVTSLKKLLDENEAFGYEIIGMGGVMSPADVDALLAAGADGVQTATAASTNPAFPSEIAGLRTEHHPSDQQAVRRIRDLLYAPDGSVRSPAELSLDPPFR
jgi:dihydroorotate dehydrogenase